MYLKHVAGLVGLLILGGCDGHRAGPIARADGSSSLDSAHAAAIEDSVRVFMAAVARDVSQRGPAAWRAHFVDSPAFFMASEGLLVLPSSDSATRAIESLARHISHIELRWSSAVRVDPLAPGLAVVAVPWSERRVDVAGHRVEEMGFFTGVAENRAGRWQFRDAHWSVVAPPPPVP